MIAKKIFILIHSFIAMFCVICAMNLTITNDIKDIAATEKIGVRFAFDSNIQSILCNTINFSVDCPQVTVLEWACSERPVSQFLPNFKRSKKVFTGPFNCELKIKMNPQNDALTDLIDVLKGSTLHISCIAIENSGQTKSINICCPIDDESAIAKLPFFSNKHDLTSDNTSSNILLNSYQKKFAIHKKINPEPGNVVLDKLMDLSIFLSDRACKIRDRIDFFLFYLILIVLIVLFLILVSRYSLMKALLGGLLRLLIFAWFVISYFFVQPFLLPYKFYFGLAALLILIAFYYIFSAKSESAKDKLKSLLGFLLVAASIPLILKAFLLFKNLG